MKRSNKYSITVLAIFFTGLCVGFWQANIANAQAKKDRVRMKMYYYKEADGARKISIALTAGSGKRMHGVKNGIVEFTSVLNDSTIYLATLETDTLGQVDIYFADDYVLPMDEDGKCIIEASYGGSEKYRSASNDIEIMDVDMEFEFAVEDSVKYLRVTAKSTNAAGDQIPVEELSIGIGVQRLYSVLPLDEIETYEDGLAELEIPDDIPGDSDGNLIFVAKIDDHDEFHDTLRDRS